MTIKRIVNCRVGEDRQDGGDDPLPIILGMDGLIGMRSLYYSCQKNPFHKRENPLRIGPVPKESVIIINKSDMSIVVNYAYQCIKIKNNQLKTNTATAAYLIILLPPSVSFILTDLFVTAPIKNNMENTTNPTANKGTSGLYINDENRSN